MNTKTMVFVVLFFLNTFPVNTHPLQVQFEINEWSILFVAVYPTDSIPTKDISEIEDIAMDVQEFMHAESFGKLDLTITIEGWLILPEAVQIYVSNFTESDTINFQIISDTLDIITAVTDIRAFDSLVIVHSGKSYQQNYYTGGIYNFGSDYPFRFGLRAIDSVAVVSEYEDMATYLKYILHSFGVPYLWWDWGWDNVGIYSFGIMGGGQAGLCGYTKASLGFLDEAEIFKFESGTINILLKAMSSNIVGYRIVKYPISEDEYYMIEARLNSGYDSELQLNGVLITYVNETAINNQEPGIIVQRREDCTRFYQAPLMIGESFYDSNTGFTVRFVEETYLGARIVVSNSPIIDWSYVEKLAIPECEEIWDVQLVWDYDEIFEDTHLYMGVVARFGSNTYLRVYDSTDYARTWTEIVNTLGNANVSLYDGALSCYNNEIVYASRIERDGSWYPAMIWLHRTRDYASYSNLSVFSDASILPWLEMISNNTTLYLAAYSVLNGTQTTYLKLGENGWSNTTLEIDLHSSFVMLDPVEGENPIIMFRKETGLYLTAFNSTESLMLSPELIWRIKGLQLDVPYAAFSVSEGDDDSYRLARVENGSLQNVIDEESFNPECQALSSYNNIITMIVRDSNGSVLHEIANQDLIRHNISEEFHYIMSRTTPIDAIWNPIIAYRPYSGSSILTAHYEYTVPQESLPIVWGRMQAPQDPLQTATYLAIFSSMVIVVGVVYIYMMHNRLQLRRGKRW